MKKSLLPILFLIIFLALIVVPGLVSAAEEKQSCWTQVDNYQNAVNMYNKGDLTYGPVTLNEYLKQKGIDTSRPETTDFSGALTTSLKNSGLPAFITSRLETWEKGLYGKDNFDGVFIKYLLLFLVIILIYSVLAYVNFPDSFGTGSSGSTFVRTLIAIIGGFLATFAITTSEIVAILQSYTALGVTLSLFFPIMILVFFTVVVATKGSPVGIFSSKIMWVIYSAYLFIKSGITMLITNGWVPGRSAIICFFLGTEGYKQAITNIRPDPVVTTVMWIASIFVFVVFVMGGKVVTAWLSKEKVDAEIQAQKQMLERSHAYDKARSQEIQRT
ncbi:hypothetical protein HYW74_04830 [Candidatus Pacearchaeota archaeon]|nr:hypothetical protein [Candidatus Pacearchaeota archaeon]